MKKIGTLLLLVTVLTMLFAGCKNNDAKKESASVPDNSTPEVTEPDAKNNEDPIQLTVWTNVVGKHAEVLENMAKEYEKLNPNIQIDFSAPGGEYENMLKVKMAAKDMPDIFSTHGWAKLRYGEFLADLSDREWADKVTESFKPIVSDEEGKLYVLPFDQDQSGPIYNTAIFEEYGIEIPATLDEFMAACETIKTKSNGEITPIVCAAEGWEEAQFFDFFATPLLISPEKNEAEALLNKTFDWNKWDVLPEKWLEMFEKGYINKDIFTVKFSDNIAKFAEGKAAIGFYGPYFIEEARALNPEIKADMMPIPAIYDGDEPTFAGGEKTTFGVWKDSPNKEAAMAFIDFCAQKENVAKVCAYTKLPPAIKGVEINAGELTKTYEKYANLRTFPYFDRVYLPNGMWDVMCKNSQSLLGKVITPREFSENMESEFNRLHQLQDN